MKKKNKRVVRYKSHINLNAGIVIFGLISIYLLINIVIYFTTERTAFYEVISGSNAQEANVSYNGIAIRNEIVECPGFRIYRLLCKRRFQSIFKYYSLQHRFHRRA